MRRVLGWRILREEKGFTLPELLVTMLVMLTVFFALHSIFDMSIKVFRFGNDKTEAVENARLAMARMEREIRGAYPVNKTNGQEHVFFDAASPLTPALPAQRSITFGNDLPNPSAAPNRRIADTLGATDPDEVITYRLNNGSGSCPALSTAGTEGVCTLLRVENGVASPVAEYVTPDGLTFAYFRSRLDPAQPGNLEAATASDGTDIGAVRIRIQVNKDGRSQTLTTDVDLRNRGA